MTDRVDHFRLAIVGAGFAGIGMAATLRREGRDDFVVLERASSVGGTWRDNTYPGCQCDVPSHLYSFSFAPKLDWTRSFSYQPEIRAYLEECADRFDVRRSIRLDTTVREAAWDEAARLWRLSTSTGDVTANVLVLGVGGLSEPAIPEIPGLDRFEGDVFHSARWRHDVDLTGKRVAVVGTGASAIQFVPAIAPLVERLTVFQRTPPWIVARRDRPIGEGERRLFGRFPVLGKLWRTGIYWGREALVVGFVHRPAILRVIERLARKHLAVAVRDPELRARLTPSYALGCKRILPSNEWYPALARENVEVVTEPIASVGPRAVVTASGREVEADAIVLGTGFRVTTHPAFESVRGRGGKRLGDVWREEGMVAYKGTTVAGFPNLFVVVGPNTGLGHTSMVFMMESQFAYIADALRRLDVLGAAAIEPKPEIQAAFNARVQERLARTVWNSGGCSSWYLDARGRNSTLWPGFTWQFRRLTRRFDDDAYAITSEERRG